MRSKTDKKKAFRLSALLSHARNCGSTNPRDKVFAFLGLVSSSYEIKVENSDQSKPYNVFTAVAKSIIETEGNLKIVAAAPGSRSLYATHDHLLSWVPDYTVPDNPNSAYSSFLRGIKFPVSNCNASRGHKPIISFEPDRSRNQNRVLKA